MPYFAAPLRPQYEQPSHNYLVPFLDALLASQAEAQQQHQQQKQQQQQQHQQRAQQPVRMNGARSPLPQNKSRPTPTPRQHNRSNRAFTPRFDIYETDDLYQLDGDLPGVSDKKSINIEFSDIRTLLVTGKVERTIPKPVAAPQQPQHEEHDDTATKRRSLNPYVEDTDDEDDMSVISHPSSEKKASSSSEVVHAAEEQQPQTTSQEPPRKVWLQERTFGTFQRTFTFPAPVDPTGVTAKLENGLLQITVPKAKVKGVRKIEIQ